MRSHPNPDLSPIRVACIASGLGHVRRGLEIWMAQLAEELQNHPEVLAEAWGGASLPNASIPFRRIRMLPRESLATRCFRWHTRYHLEQASAVLPAALALRRSRFQIAFCADPTLAWNLKRFRSWHGARVMFSDGMRLSPRWLQSYDGIHLLTPQYLSEARAVVDPARADRFFSIPYFVDGRLFRPAEADQRTASRHALGIPSDHHVALSIGPVGTDSSKRLDHLAAEIANSGSDRWTLLSVGSDEGGAAEVRSRCRAALGDRVRFLGSQPRDRLPSIFHASDLYALGALAEPFSIAIIEALACGLPVVHHQFPVTEWITGEAGIPVDMSISGPASFAFRKFAMTRDSADYRRAAALRLAEGRYGASTVASQLIEQFRAALKKPVR